MEVTFDVIDRDYDGKEDGTLGGHHLKIICR